MQGGKKMKALKKIIAVASVATFIFTAVTIPVSDTQTVITAEAATLKLNKKSLTLETGKSFNLKVKGAGKKKIKWSSSDKDIVTVNKSGKVTAKGEGTATIKAVIGRKILKCKIAVNAAETDSNTTNNGDNNDGTTTPVNTLTEIQKAKDAIAEYVKTNGTTNKRGNKEYGYTSATSTMVYIEYNERDKSLDFGYLDSVYGVVASIMSVPMDDDNPIISQKTSVILNGSTVSGYTFVTASQFKYDNTNKSMLFIVSENKSTYSSSQQQEMLNIGSSSAFSNWNLFLTLYCGGSDLNKIGFTSYTGSSSEAGAATTPAIEKTYFEKLHDYIDNSGLSDNNGNKYIRLYTNSNSMSTQDTFTITNHESMGTIQFELTYYSSGAQSTGTFEFQIDKNLNCIVLTYKMYETLHNSGYEAMSAYYQPASYSGYASSLNFSIFNSTLKAGAKNPVRTTEQLFDILLPELDTTMRNEIGFGLSEIGFTGV